MIKGHKITGGGVGIVGRELPLPNYFARICMHRKQSITGVCRGVRIVLAGAVVQNIFA